MMTASCSTKNSNGKKSIQFSHKYFYGRNSESEKAELYWSESESDIAWNGHTDFPIVYLHWLATKIKEISAFAFAAI